MTPSVSRIVFVTEPDGSFGSAGQSWLTLDLRTLRRQVEVGGYHTTEVRIDRLLDFNFRDDDLVYYASSSSDHLRAYARDIIYFIGLRVPIVPSFSLMLAHESKGVQEIIKKTFDFGNLHGQYHVDIDENEVSMPYVFKTSAGAGSSGVHLIKNEFNENNLRYNYFRQSFSRNIKLFYRQLKLKNRQHIQRYVYYYKRFFPYITQPFIAGLKGDIKILVFGDRYFVLNRANRPNDFRASGSGRLDFHRPCADHVLDFARNIFEILNTPHVSLDIAEMEGRCYLLEFQALNFGPATLLGSTGYYERSNESWKRVTAKSSLEEVYAHSLIHYLERYREPQA